jgi:hypothetical protein
MGNSFGFEVNIRQGSNRPRRPKLRKNFFDAGQRVQWFEVIDRLSPSPSAALIIHTSTQPSDLRAWLSDLE